MINEATMEELEDLMGMGIFSSLFSEIPSMLINLAVYVFTALALYTIAKRRGINKPWLAWIPFANTWLLGCISDQYRSVVHGEVKNRRKVLLGLQIAISVLTCVIIVLCIVMLGNLLMFGLDNLDNNMSEAAAKELLNAVMGPAAGMILVAIPMMVVAIIYCVFFFIALHDIYKSCDPDNATLYLILSIFISYTQPIFLFICRNKDGGMPPRREEVPFQPPVLPAEPWEQKEE